MVQKIYFLLVMQLCIIANTYSQHQTRQYPHPHYNERSAKKKISGGIALTSLGAAGLATSIVILVKNKKDPNPQHRYADENPSIHRMFATGGLITSCMAIAGGIILSYSGKKELYKFQNGISVTASSKGLSISCAIGK